MKVIKQLICLVFMLIIVIGCDQREFLEKITPPEDDQLARELIERLRQNDLDYILSNFDRSQLGDDPRGTLLKLYDYIDHDTPKNTELVGCYIGYLKGMEQSTRKNTNLTYQIEFPSSWYTVDIVVITENGNKKVFGFHINKIPASLEEVNRFTFEGKAPSYYIVMLVTILIPIFILFALIVCIRTKVRLKWLWIIFILLGFGKATFNWTTGYLLFHLGIYVQLFGMGFFRSGLYGPWIITLSVPLGAIIFLLLRKKIRIQKIDVPEPTTSNVPAMEIEDQTSEPQVSATG